jgi:sulfite exporter TauE/SafE
MEITPEAPTFSILAIGFALGLQHATEADHLAAVSTIVSEKKNLLTASIVGGLWGIGHTISLFAVGMLVIFLKLQISHEVEAKLEACVGAMLIILGLNALRKLFTASKIHVHSHKHDGREHIHIHTHHNEQAAVSHHRLTFRSIAVGMVHGLAGSAALMLLVVPIIESNAVAMLYILIFGIGSIGGMVVMSFLIGLPFHFTSGRFHLLNRGIRLVACLISLGLGSSIVYQNLLQA